MLFLFPYFYVACAAQKCFHFMFSCTDSFVKVDVKEINFVTPDVQALATPEFQKKESRGEDELENYRNRIQLWQIFLASPFEWMDFRKSKINPKYPDFKNRDTGEVLWLRTDDPPWIKRQLDILDSRFSYESF
ncbi:protein OSB1, mitochondrial-like [Solanum verrucosum]|uniref:protein OSB1, mitochondrial-like n=1 Tax=Solanum verrucosum TaxID=315347 RepID=UPI0020D11E95|nr:protein OSB1, mitochondrial-like [Solanum verrucosum]